MPRLLVAHAQSSLGTGAAYVALLLLAYERFRSPWAVTAVLLCELAPGVLLGPFVGAAADRWSRKRLLVGADVLRAVAFAGLALVDSFAATVVLAALAGVGQAAFAPTIMATLPDLVPRSRLPRTTSLYSSLEDVGYTAGPGLAALAYLVTGAEGILAANAVTFAVGAAVVATLPIGARRAPAAEAGEVRPGLWRSAALGVRSLAGLREARTVILASTAFVCFLGAVNVGELLLVREELGGSASQFSLVVAVMGIGMAAGSLLGARASTVELCRRRYLAGLALCAGALLACALVPSIWWALPVFAVLGVGNGVALVHENLFLQQAVPEAVRGRVFGIKQTLVSGAMVLSYVGGGALGAALGARTLFVVLAAGGALAWLLTVGALRRATVASSPEAPRVDLVPALLAPSGLSAPR